MTPRALLVLAALLFAANAEAETSLAGNWKLTIAHQPPCTLAMTDDGTVMPGADCVLSVTLAHWKGTSDGIQLQTAAGETYAVLKPKDGAYEGKTFADMRELTLSR